MKRTITLTMLATLAFVAFAALPLWGADDVTTPRNQGPAFVDADGDGVCDNYTAGGRGQGAKQGRGQGVRSGRGTGSNFVDADNDGVCDNRTAQKSAARRGTGRCNRRGGGMGRGAGLNQGNTVNNQSDATQ